MPVPVPIRSPLAPYTKRYRATDLICASHNVRFVRYECRWATAVLYSHGCPVCVGLIRAKVQKELGRRRRVC